MKYTENSMIVQIKTDKGECFAFNNLNTGDAHTMASSLYWNRGFGFECKLCLSLFHLHYSGFTMAPSDLKTWKTAQESIQSS